jgi:hypothetical protein
VAPSHLDRGAKLGLIERREFGACPAGRAPTAFQRRKGFRREKAFELLFIGREPDVGALAIGGERCEDARRAKGEAVEMGRFAHARQRKRDAPQIFAARHWSLPRAQAYALGPEIAESFAKEARASKARPGAPTCDGDGPGEFRPRQVLEPGSR